MGLGQYDSLGEYCDPSTASSVSYISMRYSTYTSKLSLLHAAAFYRVPGHALKGLKYILKNVSASKKVAIFERVSFERYKIESQSKLKI